MASPGEPRDDARHQVDGVVLDARAVEQCVVHPIAHLLVLPLQFAQLLDLQVVHVCQPKCAEDMKSRAR